MTSITKRTQKQITKQVTQTTYRYVDHPDPIINRIQNNVVAAIAPLQRLASIVDDGSNLLTSNGSPNDTIIVKVDSNDDLFSATMEII